MLQPRRILTLILLLALACGVLTGCRRRAPSVKLDAVKRPQVDNLELFKATPIGAPAGDQPWIAHVFSVDLDRDGLLDVLACDSKESKVLWLRQLPNRSFEERVLAADMRAPVQAVSADMDKDGDLDVIVSSMSVVFPNNDKIGALFILENDGRQNFKPHLIMENVSRVCDARPGDFNNDGQIDLVLAQFGYDQGEVRYLERTGPWTFKEQVVLNLSGSINVCVADFNGDRNLDFAALISQQWEEVFLFTGDGKGNFKSKVIFGSTNEDYATSNMSLCDLNKDGRPDLIFSNGDGFGPSPQPGPRPWHGVQVLENLGGNNFKFRRVGDLGGAYAPIEVDIDQDGFMDVLAVSGFNEWSKPNAVSMIWYKHDGKWGFTPTVLAYQPTHLLTLAVGDYTGDGKPDIVSGTFHASPPYYSRYTRILLWTQR